jgi:hypothetical protein
MAGNAFAAKIPAKTPLNPPAGFAAKQLRQGAHFDMLQMKRVFSPVSRPAHQA